jgi:hypothetical protein
MPLLYAGDALGVEVVPRFPQQHVRKEATAHANFPMDSPDRQRDPFVIQRFLPCQHVLVNAVDQRAVEIEDECRFNAVRHGHSIPAHCAPKPV